MTKRIKIATFNVEWMANLFKNGKPVLLTKQSKQTPGLGAKPKNPHGVANRIAAVIEDLNADIVGICAINKASCRANENARRGADRCCRIKG